MLFPQHLIPGEPGPLLQRRLSHQSEPLQSFDIEPALDFESHEDKFLFNCESGRSIRVNSCFRAKTADSCDGTGRQKGTANED